MFTGLITEVGRIERATEIPNGVELIIRAPRTAARLSIGASLAVNGVCLTITKLDPPHATVQAVGATMTTTTFGRDLLREGARVNLEPSLRAGDELGGHLVAGHVDGVGTVVAIKPDGEAVWLTINVPNELSRYVARRGSIAIDGVSLTVAALEDAPDGARITMSIIPHTLKETICGEYQPGRPVNIEVDTVARYLERLLPSEGRS
ncbi:MAG TPA: riboflavin synthase [Candidatus Eisenbacteria bacterium]